MDKSRSSVKDETSQAAASLKLLLREDPDLSALQGDQADPFAYAASLLDSGTNQSHQRLATAALHDVERKLALVESLSVKLSRTSPEEVTKPFLQLHGLDAPDDHSVITLPSIRERASRLERQAESLESTAQRVETVLLKGSKKIQMATEQLDRVLEVSNALKRILRLQFESQKLANYDLEDVRDLTRAAASVAVLEDLLSSPELATAPIAVVEAMRPLATKTAHDVRRAARDLLQRQDVTQLGSVLQVYFHLHELPEAVWQAVDQAHSDAMNVSRQLWNASTLQNMQEKVKKQAKKQGDSGRSMAKHWKQVRADASREWAEGILAACELVRNLHRVLSMKTDPVSRVVFADVVGKAPVPNEYGPLNDTDEFSLFRLFWGRLCVTISSLLEEVAEQHHSIGTDVAALYPAVRASSLELLGHLSTEHLSAGKASYSEGSIGILGGASILNDPFLGWCTTAENPQSASAVRWTVKTPMDASGSHRSSGRKNFLSNASASSRILIQNSFEWKTLQGKATSKGLYLLEQAFVNDCYERLIDPLQYLFPENVTIDDDGVAMASGLSLLPSKYDLQRFDENIRLELSKADPREGGGDLTLVTMIAECVVSMISEFCVRAKKAMSGATYEEFVVDSDWSMTENLQHDRKVVAIMYTLGKYLNDAPDKTFVAPYQPTVLPQHTESSALCAEALEPATTAIDNTVKVVVLLPLCRALNDKITRIFGRIHGGLYVTSADESPLFVQKHVSPIFQVIADKHLSKFPPVYATVLCEKVAAFAMSSFLSTVSMVRPMGESTRLHITQDLADLEMALEQFVGHVTGLSLHTVDGGKPYSELRAVRQMLYWTGLENTSKSADELAKSILRELWIKDLRPSTIYHYLFSFGPSLLSSPHHIVRCSAAEYVNRLVPPDGSPPAEDMAWMTIVSSCDSYQQRASSGNDGDGDARVADIVLTLGQELLRRGGRN